MLITVKKIVEVCEGTLLVGKEDIIISSYSKDTRTIKNGDCYLGIRGEVFDGNTFWREAIEKGAKACILDSWDQQEEFFGDCAIILVQDTVKAIQKLAMYVREQLDIPVVAVTGSVGKTSTKDLIASVLSQKYKVLKSPGNLNSQIGLPLNILRYQDEEVMVLEMGMNDFGQISLLSRIAKPTIAVITNIGTAHIGILGSRENILKAKLEILDGMKENAPLVLNIDNDLLNNVVVHAHPIISCGIEGSSMFKATNISLAENETSFVLNYEDKKKKIVLPLLGKVFVLNALLAAAVGHTLNCSLEQIKNGLESLSREENHMQIFTLKNNVTIIDDTYNSNLEAVLSALNVLIKYPAKRHIAVLGDILELENFSESIHRQIGMAKEIRELDALFLLGESAKYIKESALENGMQADKIFYFEDREFLKQKLKEFLQEEDVVLIKASNAMKFKEIVQFLETL